VYEDRPRQCRTWPFWDSNLKSPEAWLRACDVCPGSGQGKLYSIELIQEQAAVIRV
jgi:Fe-S-cluster containining protein